MRDTLLRLSVKMKFLEKNIIILEVRRFVASYLFLSAVEMLVPCSHDELLPAQVHSQLGEILHSRVGELGHPRPQRCVETKEHLQL